MKKLTKSEMLHVVIRKMTSNQKKMFGFEMKKFSKHNHYTLTFDFFLNLKKYDKTLFNDFIKKNSIPNHYSVVSYLLDKLIVFIYKTKSESSISKISLELEELKEKGRAYDHFHLTDQAIKTWKKMFRIADTNNKFQYCIEAFKYLYQYNEVEYLENFTYSDNLKLTIYERLAKYGLSQTKANQLKVLHFNIFRLIYNKKSSKEDWAKLSKLNLLEELPHYDYYGTLLHYSTKGLLKVKTEGTKAGAEVYKKFKQANQKFIVLRNFNTKNIFDADYLFLICLYWCDKPNEYVIEANHFKGLMDLYKNKIHKSNKRKLNKMSKRFNLLNAVIQAQRLTFEKEYQIHDIRNLHENKNWIESSHSKMTQANALLFFCYLCILIKKYNEFYKYQLLLEKALSELKDPSHFSYDFELLQLIVLYENDTSYYFNNRLKRFIIRIKKQNDCQTSVLKITKLLKRLSNSKQPIKLMKDSVHEIKNQEIKDASGHRVLPFYIWLERRCELDN